MKRILITEVTTTADKLLVQQLVAAEFSVRTMAANVNAGNPLLQLPVEIFAGTALNAANLVSATKGCDYVINNSLHIMGKREQSQPAKALLKTFELLEALQKTQVKLVIHLQQVDESNQMFLTHKTDANCSEALAVVAPYTMLNTVQQLIVSKKYVANNNKLVISASEINRPHNAGFGVDISWPVKCILSLIQNEYSAQVYLIRPLKVNGDKMANSFLNGEHKFLEFTRHATVFIKAEFWRSLLYACF